jgi:alpha-galactosidase
MWNVVSKDKKQAIGMLVQKEVMPNEMYACFRAKGLDPDMKYHFTNIKTEYNVKLFGDLINTAAPFHVKPGSLMQNLIAKFVKMPGEVEDYVCYGSAIMNEGVRLHQSFVGTGYDGDVRFFPDYSGRLYFMEAVEE